ncbi:hypothetical protein ACE103_09505 [Bradyrhizobium sp. ma5]|uniref:hypothetical protein n=1 Tax=Bradyrhizobium sp. ma5 TaxID=3344828 RepID=UPI0035D4826E
MVHLSPEGLYGVDVPNPWKLVKAAQELKEANDNLRRQLDTQRAEIERVEGRGQLIRVGAIRTIKQCHAVVRNMLTIIPHDELARVSETYVSLFTLAREQRLNMSGLLRRLRAVGVKPAPELEGVGATFFRRSDLRS